MKQCPWNVYLRGKLVDTVFYDEDCVHEYVYHSLVYHDGYDQMIQVRKVVNRREK